MILTRQSIEMGPEGYIEIDMDGDDELLSSTYKCNFLGADNKQ